MKLSFFPAITLATTFVLSTNKLTTVNAALRGNNEIEQQGHRVLSEEVTATFFVSETELEGHTVSETGDRRLRKLPGKSDRKLNIGLDDGTFYEVKNAAGTGWADGLISGESKVGLPPGVIVRSDGSVDMGGKDPNPNSNAGGNGNGNGVGNPFHRDLEAARTPEQERNLAEVRRNLATVGSKSVLAVWIKVNDGEYSHVSSLTALSNDVFGNGVDPVNLKSQYEECSYDQLIINKAANRGMSSSCTDCTGISNGVVKVKVNNNVSQGDGTIRNAVTSQLNSMFNVGSPNQLANHVMYCLPNGVMNGIAYAYINSWNSVYSNEWCNYLSTQMHELGHNFGYAHANEGGTYRDQTGMMGYSYSQDDGPIMCFNGAKSYQTGWYTDKTVVVTPTDCFEGDIHGVATARGVPGSTVIVKIDDPNGSTSHFVNFNAKTGINSGTVEGGNQVTVTRTGSEGLTYAESELVAKRGNGGTWSASVGGVNMVVTVKSISGSTSANVLIAPSGVTTCNVGTASPTDSPTKKPTASPVTPAPTSSPTNPVPTASPSKKPTASPTTLAPTNAPTTAAPTSPPTQKPTSSPISCGIPSLNKKNDCESAGCQWNNLGRNKCCVSPGSPSNSCP